MRYLRIGFLGLLLCIAAVGGVAASPGDDIEQVEIRVMQTDDTAGNMENRVVASVQAVSEKLLIGRKVSDVEASRHRFADIIRQVFDRVLYGYELTDVSVIPGKKTVISLSILPWGDVVKSTSVHIDAGSFAQADQTLISRDLAGIERKIDQILIGLPVDAFAWADSVSKALIREAFTAQLPEFRADIEFVPAQNTTVNIKLQPIGPLIRKTEVSMLSDSIPKLLLWPVNDSAEVVVEQLNGLPVAFVQRHREEYVQRMQQSINDIKYINRFHLSTEIDLDLGERTKAEVHTDTDKYKIKLEGVLDLGSDDKDNTLLRGHAGYLTRKKDEIFVDVEFYPNTISWHVEPGYGWQLSPKTYLGIKRDLRDSEDIGILRYRLRGDLWFNWEQNLTTGYREAGIRYQIHDYLAAEAISNEEKTWLRIIADL